MPPRVPCIRECEIVFSCLAFPRLKFLSSFIDFSIRFVSFFVEVPELSPFLAFFHAQFRLHFILCPLHTWRSRASNSILRLRAMRCRVWHSLQFIIFSNIFLLMAKENRCAAFFCWGPAQEVEGPHCWLTLCSLLS